MKHALQGTISHIQRMSLHDGQGIRTTIFFKGCNMRCRWCHNPETFSPNIEQALAKAKCIRCGVCIEKCPKEALYIKNGEIFKNRNLCAECGVCIDECYAAAHYRVGAMYTVDELCAKVEEDRSIFERSNGGVTISGGEPTLQYPFLIELVKALRAKRFHITLQTNMSADWDKYAELLPYVNHFMCDLKLLDAKAHKEHTGKDNQRILENIKKIDASDASYCVRTPVIPNVNDDKEQLSQIADFVSELERNEKYELIPFHPFASYKYENLGMEYEFK